MVVDLAKFAPMNQCYQYYSLDTFLEDMSKTGYRKVDLWGGPAHFRITPFFHSNTESLLQKLDKLNLTVTCLTPSQSPPQPYNLANSSSSGYEEMIAYFQQAIYAAYELNIPYVLVTPGWHLIGENVANAWRRSVMSCRLLCMFAAKYGITIVFEPLLEDSIKLVTSLTEVRKYMLDVNRENLKIVIDTGTVFRNGDSFSEYFEVFGESIVYCHLTSYAPGNAGHLSWVDGILDLPSIMKTFEKFDYQGDFCLEYTDKIYRTRPKEVYEKDFALLKKMEE